MLQNIQTLKISRTKEMIFSAVFTLLAVATPTVIHYFSGVDGGRTFLPMPFFVILAGLLLGWRAGLATALMSPIVSYLLSGMPMVDILPFIILQLAAYGAVAGTMREKHNAIISVAGAILAGWAIIGISMFLFSKMNAWSYVIQGVRAGLLGIIIQLIAIPAIVFLIQSNFRDEKGI